MRLVTGRLVFGLGYAPAHDEDGGRALARGHARVVTTIGNVQNVPRVRIADIVDSVGTESGEQARRKLRAMRRLVLITVACEGFAALRYAQYAERAELFGGAAIALVACAAFGWFDRHAERAVIAAWFVEAAVVAASFPDNANHQFLALLLLALIALARAGQPGMGPAPAASDSTEVDEVKEPSDARLALQAMRWIVASGLFWSGFMKLWYGHWFGGEFLAFRIATDPGFARVFAAILPDAELVRLVALENRIGAGPFRAEAPLLIALSNLTWLAEMALGVGLLFERTRRLALVGSLGLLLAIQLAAREFFFAGLMVGALLLFEPRDRVSAFVPVAGAGYLAWLWVSWTSASASLAGAS